MENTDKNTIKNIATIRSKHDKGISVSSMTDAQFDDMIRNAFKEYPETLNHLNDTAQMPDVPQRNHWEDSTGSLIGHIFAYLTLVMLGIIGVGTLIVIVYLLSNLI